MRVEGEEMEEVDKLKHLEVITGADGGLEGGAVDGGKE